jgi:hypothetical protein
MIVLFISVDYFALTLLYIGHPPNRGIQVFFGGICYIAAHLKRSRLKIPGSLTWNQTSTAIVNSQLLNNDLEPVHCSPDTVLLADTVYVISVRLMFAGSHMLLLTCSYQPARIS